MSITLETIKDRTERRLHDIHDVDNGLLFDWATDLNQFLYEEMQRVDPERFTSTRVYTVTSSPSTQALPTDFKDITKVGCGFFIRDTAGRDTVFRLNLTSFGSISQGYYITGNNVVFTGINSSMTLVLRYIPELADIDSLSDIFVVPDYGKKVLKSGMILAYYEDEEDAQMQVQEQIFIRDLSQFLDRIKKAPNIVGFTTSINSGA